MPRDGRAVAGGTPAEVLTPALIERVHGVRAEVTQGPGHPVIRFPRPTDRGGRSAGTGGAGAPPTAP
ncbi:ABC-type cobalamin/Fe3+-siderophores transport system ATPase subunit [Streptomyces sp. MJP52]|nr:ABC-type cobalamin/Fe3+-siderophores transport system ATPase subunit [Streptomyces sp. MJP52]